MKVKNIEWKLSGREKTWNRSLHREGSNRKTNGIKGGSGVEK